MHIFCDFDGTISLKDTTDEILSHFASPKWEAIEDEWKRGDIGSAECMRRQIPLIQASKKVLDETLDSLAIDPSFPEFVRYCESHGLPVTVISDGVDYFIHHILKRYNLDHLPVIANHLTITNDTYILSCPHTNAACTSASGVCKCQKIDAHTGTRVFVGDGRSDFCAAGSADVVFAKESLATYCEQEAIAYTPYHHFSDVQQSLKRLLVRPATAANIQAAANYTT